MFVATARQWRGAALGVCFALELGCAAAPSPRPTPPRAKAARSAVGLVLPAPEASPEPAGTSIEPVPAMAALPTLPPDVRPGEVTRVRLPGSRSAFVVHGSAETRRSAEPTPELQSRAHPRCPP